MYNNRLLPLQQPDDDQSAMMEDVGYLSPRQGILCGGEVTQFIASLQESIPPLLINAPVLVFTDPHPAVTGKQLAALSRTTAPLPSTAPSLTAALQSTVTTETTARLVVIPAERRNQSTKQTRPGKGSSKRYLSSRLRQSIVLSTILVMVIITLSSLVPLTSGESAFPLFSGIGKFFSMQLLNGQISAHTDDQRVNNPVQSGPPPMTLPKSQYVAIAQQDAIDAGISPVYFVRQINEESGFNPNAVSPAGAVGIAQFLPSTAAGLGIDPYNPIQSLRGAAHLMASYAKNYGGDYAKALAAYNGGSGTVQHAISACGANWLNCVPPETRHYIYVIMGI